MQKLFKAFSISLLSSIAFISYALAHSNLNEDTAKFSPQKCYLPELELPEDFVVYAANSFSGLDLNRTIDTTSNQSGEVVWITVNSPLKPVVLVIANHQPSIWKFRWTENTEIIGVLATGYHRQAIAGLPQETPIKISTLENEDECGYIDPVRNIPDNRLLLQALSKTIFGQKIENFFYSEEEVVGEPIAEEDLKHRELLSSDDTPVIPIL